GEEPNLQNIKIKHLFFISNGKLELRPHPGEEQNLAEYLHEKCNVPFNKNMDISKVEGELKKRSDALNFIRGKYVYSFFVMFVQNVYNDIGSISTSVSTPPKMHVVFGEENAIKYIAASSRMPDSVRGFIEKNCCNFVRDCETIHNQ
ncbi:MAG: hypothetical protein ABFC78_04585, partial [Methanoregula sp.]